MGLLLGLSHTAWRYSMASVEVIRAIPPVSLVPVALLVFGFSIRMELTIIFFVSAWPVLVPGAPCPFKEAVGKRL